MGGGIKVQNLKKFENKSTCVKEGNRGFVETKYGSGMAEAGNQPR